MIEIANEIAKECKYKDSKWKSERASECVCVTLKLHDVK